MAGAVEASSSEDTVLSAAVDCELTVTLMAGLGVFDTAISVSFGRLKIPLVILVALKKPYPIRRSYLQVLLNFSTS